MMSATQMNSRPSSKAVSEARAGAVALVLLRFTLVGVVLALVGTVGNVVLKVMHG